MSRLSIYDRTFQADEESYCQGLILPIIIVRSSFFVKSFLIVFCENSLVKPKNGREN